jgi:hypothetical protein
MKSNKKREESESRFMTACYLVKQLYDTELHCMSRCCIEEMLAVSVHTHTYMCILCHMSLICECEQCEFEFEKKNIFFPISICQDQLINV